MNICGENANLKVSAVIAHKIKSIYFQIHHAPPGAVVGFAVVFGEAKKRCSSAAGLQLGSPNLEACSSETKYVACHRAGCFETTFTQCYISSFGKGSFKQRSQLRLEQNVGLD